MDGMKKDKGIPAQRMIFCLLLFTICIFCISGEFAAAKLPSSVTIYVFDTWKPENKVKNAKWTSSNKKIAAVEKTTGLISGVNAGTCTVTCKKVNGKKQTIRVVVKNRNRPENFPFIGHRGNTDRYPENTLISFKSALRRGCDGIECDVFLTESGDFLVFHDSLLNRLCKVDGNIRNVSVSNRGQYPIRESKYCATHRVIIPTLEEVLALVRSYGGKIFIHIKNGAEFDPDAADRLISLIDSYDMREDSVIFAPNLYFLDLVRNRGLHLGYWTQQEDEDMLKEEIRFVEGKGIEYILLYVPRQINKEIVDLIHKSGMLVGVYKTVSMKRLQLLYNLQADFALFYHVEMLH